MLISKAGIAKKSFPLNSVRIKKRNLFATEWKNNFNEKAQKMGGKLVPMGERETCRALKPDLRNPQNGAPPPPSALNPWETPLSIPPALFISREIDVLTIGASHKSFCKYFPRFNDFPYEILCFISSLLLSC